MRLSCILLQQDRWWFLCRTTCRVYQRSGHIRVDVGELAKALQYPSTTELGQYILVAFAVKYTNGCRGRKLANARGMWGLMAFPSSSTAAGAVPAFRAASRSFCLRNSSRDSFPDTAREIRERKLRMGQFCAPGPEAMTARVKDRPTKPRNTIVLKFRHVPSLKRVLPRSPTIVPREMTTHVGVLPTDILNVVTDKLRGHPRFLRLPHPRTGV